MVSTCTLGAGVSRFLACRSMKRRCAMHDVIVIGAGPAGLAAATHALRHHLNTLVIAPDLAGKAAYRLRLPWLTEREYISGEETVAELRRELLVSPDVKRYLDSVEQVFIHEHAFQVITAEGGAAL